MKVIKKASVHQDKGGGKKMKKKKKVLKRHDIIISKPFFKAYITN